MANQITIKQARENSRLTIQEVSDRTGMTVQQIQNLEFNSKRAAAFNVMMLCKLYKISPDHVYFGRTPNGQVPTMEGEPRCAITA
jgi:transcriptional regulator with XRE-family HTH domain